MLENWVRYELAHVNVVWRPSVMMLMSVQIPLTDAYVLETNRYLLK
jgi:hypothetical protein